MTIALGSTLIGSLDFALVGRATIVLALGLVATSLADQVSAAVRHLFMLATFSVILMVPLLTRTVPVVTVEVPTVAAGDVASDTFISIAMAFRWIWAFGALALLVVLATDLRRLRVLKRAGLPWLARNDFFKALFHASGVRRSVDILLHEGVSAPLTFGVWRHTILLPIDASDWPEGDLERALVHELEHVRRRDWMSQLLARAVCASYWFHPLVWMAWTRLRLEAERACDDAVLQRAECTEYAEQLVTLAKRMQTTRALPSLAMADRSDLSARVVALLDGTRRRGRAGYAATATVVAFASLMMVGVASVRAIAAPAASVIVHTVVAALDPVVVNVPVREVTQRGQVTARVTRMKADPPAMQASSVLPLEPTASSRDTVSDVQPTISTIHRWAGGSASGEATGLHSSSASSSASASSN